MATSSLASSDWVSIGGDGEPRGPTAIVLESNETKTLIRFDIHGFWAREIVESGESYRELKFPRYGTTMDIGKAAVPVISHLVTIPGEVAVRVGIVECTEVELSGYRVYPYQRPLREPEVRSSFDFDPAFYREDAFYPGERALVGEPAIWRDLRVVTLTVHPIRYNPARSGLVVCSSITVQLDYTGRNEQNRKTPPSLPIFDSYDTMYRRNIINYDALDWNLPAAPEPDLREIVQYDYLFIVADQFEDNIAPLVGYKESIGLATKVALVSEIESMGPGGDLVEEIRGYIQGEYETSGIRYVLLVGDENAIPAHTGYGFFSDYYYALVDGTDDLPDIGMGRFSAASADQVDNLVAKSITYESDPPHGEWLEEVLLVAHWEYAPLKYQECKELVRLGGETWSGGYGFLWPVFTTAYGASAENGGNGARNQTVIDHINAGKRIVNYRGHGSEVSWPFWNTFFEYFTPADVARFTNGEMTPVVFGIACLTSNLLYPGECLGESFTRGDEGAVAYLGATHLSVTEVNHTYDKQLFSLIFDEGVNCIADASNEAAVRIIVQHDSIGIYNARMYLWLGDPSLAILPGLDAAAPTLCSPQDSARLALASTLTLEWYPVPNAPRYLVQIDDAPGFESPEEFVSSYCANGTCLCSVSPPDGGTWYWRVRVDLELWPWSEPWVFTVREEVAPSCPVLFAYDGTGFRDESLLLTACGRSHYTDVVTDYCHVKGFVGLRDGKIIFQIRELEDEVTFLEDLELITVDHHPVTFVHCTADGRVNTYDRSLSPLSARDGGGVDRLSALSAADGVRFEAEGPGELVLTFPTSEIGITPIIDGLDEERCPLVEEERSTLIQLSAASPTVEGCTEVRLSWVEGFSADVIEGYIRSAEDPIVNRHPATNHRLHLMGDEPGGGFAGAPDGGLNDESGGKLDGALRSDRVPLELHRGDILEFEFDAGGGPAPWLSRDYIVKARGRYEPDYSVYMNLVPASTGLYTIYPNPFNPVTTIRFDLHRSSSVRLEIFDVAGRRIATLVDGVKEPGRHEVDWDGSTGGGGRAASGVYFCRFSTEDIVISRKVILLR